MAEPGTPKPNGSTSEAIANDAASRRKWVTRHLMLMTTSPKVEKDRMMTFFEANPELQKAKEGQVFTPEDITLIQRFDEYMKDPSLPVPMRDSASSSSSETPLPASNESKSTKPTQPTSGESTSEEAESKEDSILSALGITPPSSVSVSHPASTTPATVASDLSADVPPSGGINPEKRTDWEDRSDTFKQRYKELFKFSEENLDKQITHVQELLDKITKLINEAAKKNGETPQKMRSKLKAINPTGDLGKYRKELERIKERSGAEDFDGAKNREHLHQMRANIAQYLMEFRKLYQAEMGVEPPTPPSPTPDDGDVPVPPEPSPDDGDTPPVPPAPPAPPSPDDVVPVPPPTPPTPVPSPDDEPPIPPTPPSPDRPEFKNWEYLAAHKENWHRDRADFEALYQRKGYKYFGQYVPFGLVKPGWGGEYSEKVEAMRNSRNAYLAILRPQLEARALRESTSRDERESSRDRYERHQEYKTERKKLLDRARSNVTPENRTKKFRQLVKDGTVLRHGRWRANERIQNIDTAYRKLVIQRFVVDEGKRLVEQQGSLLPESKLRLLKRTGQYLKKHKWKVRLGTVVAAGLVTGGAGILAGATVGAAAAAGAGAGAMRASRMTMGIGGAMLGGGMALKGLDSSVAQNERLLSKSEEEAFAANYDELMSDIDSYTDRYRSSYQGYSNARTRRIYGTAAGALAGGVLAGASADDIISNIDSLLSEVDPDVATDSLGNLSEVPETPDSAAVNVDASNGPETSSAAEKTGVEPGTGLGDANDLKPTDSPRVEASELTPPAGHVGGDPYTENDNVTPETSEANAIDTGGVRVETETPVESAEVMKQAITVPAGSSVSETLYDAFKAGKLEGLPEGMSRTDFLNKMYAAIHDLDNNTAVMERMGIPSGDLDQVAAGATIDFQPLIEHINGASVADIEAGSTAPAQVLAPTETPVPEVSPIAQAVEVQTAYEGSAGNADTFSDEELIIPGATEFAPEEAPEASVRPLAPFDASAPEPAPEGPTAVSDLEGRPSTGEIPIPPERPTVSTESVAEVAASPMFNDHTSETIIANINSPEQFASYKADIVRLLDERHFVADMSDTEMKRLIIEIASTPGFDSSGFDSGAALDSIVAREDVLGYMFPNPDNADSFYISGVDSLRDVTLSDLNRWSYNEMASDYGNTSLNVSDRAFASAKLNLFNLFKNGSLPAADFPNTMTVEEALEKLVTSYQVDVTENATKLQVTTSNGRALFDEPIAIVDFRNIGK